MYCYDCQYATTLQHTVRPNQCLFKHPMLWGNNEVLRGGYFEVRGCDTSGVQGQSLQSGVWGQSARN